jgi:hypothetical protein
VLWVGGRREGVRKEALPHAGSLLGLAASEKSQVTHFKMPAI